jgi:hypothetical protein
MDGFEQAVVVQFESRQPLSPPALERPGARLALRTRTVTFRGTAFNSFLSGALRPRYTQTGE